MEVKRKTGAALYQKAGRVSVIIAGNVLAVGVAAYNEAFAATAFFTFLLLLVVFGSLFAAHQLLIKPAINLIDALKNLDEGTVEEIQEFRPEGELEEAGRHLLGLSHQIAASTNFIELLAADKVDIENNAFFETLNPKSRLDSAIQSVGNRLQSFAEEERQRSWSSDSLSNFMEILRSENDDSRHLYDKITSEIVKYIGARQGALFLSEETEGRQILALKAWYAYDRKKYQGKEILPGEGLVGQVFLEKEPAYLTDLPGDYPEISSGLGQAQAVSVFIIPLITNNTICGVLEINSFSPVPEYRRDFVIRLSENIASAITSMDNMEQIKKLLFASQKQSEQMRAQEEEMRQNLEELTATQEEMRRKQAELELANQKMKQNEEILRQAVQKSREQHRLVEEKNEAIKKQYEKTAVLNKRLRASEEILKKAFLGMRKQKEVFKQKIADAEALLGTETEKNKLLEAKLAEAVGKKTS